MNMILHTFKKDARRLWPGVILSLALLAIMAGADRWRSEPVAGPVESSLNLILPLAWACLVGLAVLEEPLTGDRHFWLTRPHRWTTLLAAKVVFALVFVHLPALLADLYVLIARGFSPFECLPQLLEKQAMLAAAVTLPGIALATLVGGFTPFVMLLIGVAAVAAIVSADPFRAMPYIINSVERVRTGLVAAIVAGAAVAIVVLQYRVRKLAIARAAALLTVLLAGALFAYVPQSLLLRSRVQPVKSLELRTARQPGCANPSCVINETLSAAVSARMTMYNRDTVGIPVELSGVPSGAHYRVGDVELTLTAPDGSRYRNAGFTGQNQPADVLLLAGIRRFPEDLGSAPLTLFLHFNRELYRKLKDQHVRATGRVLVDFYRMGATASMPVNGRVVAPGIGHCSNALSETRWSENIINVLCESPSPLPRTTYATLTIPGIEREWNEWLRSIPTRTEGLRAEFLSPLNRARTFFNTADSRVRAHNFGLEVPLGQIGKAKISVTAEIAAGVSLVEFDLPDLPLAANRIRPYSER